MLTSTCSFDQLSMLKDLTLEMCVPNFRWMAAHRMHRKTPNCGHCQCRLACLGSDMASASASARVDGLREGSLHSMMPKLVAHGMSAKASKSGRPRGRSQVGGS